MSTAPDPDHITRFEKPSADTPFSDRSRHSRRRSSKPMPTTWKVVPPTSHSSRPPPPPQHPVLRLRVHKVGPRSRLRPRPRTRPLPLPAPAPPPDRRLPHPPSHLSLSQTRVVLPPEKHLSPIRSPLHLAGRLGGLSGSSVGVAKAKAETRVGRRRSVEQGRDRTPSRTGLNPREVGGNAERRVEARSHGCDVKLWNVR